MEIKRKFIFVLIILHFSNFVYSKDIYSFKGIVTAIQVINDNRFRIQINNDYNFSYYQFDCDSDGIKNYEELKLSKKEILNNYRSNEKKYEKEIQENKQLIKIISKEKQKLLKKINKERTVDVLNTVYNFYSYSDKEQIAIFTNDDGDYIYNSVFIKKGKKIEKIVFPGYVIGVLPFENNVNVVVYYNIQEDISFISLLE